MKKIFTSILIIIASIAILTGCVTNNSNESQTDLSQETNLSSQETDSAKVTEETTTETRGGYGGDYTSIFYEREFIPLFYFGASADYFEENGTEIFLEWVDRQENSKNDPNRPCLTLLDFIHEYDVSKEAFARVAEENPTIQITPEEIDILFSDDLRAIRETFVASWAIYADGEIYTPEKLHSLSFEEMQDLGITKDMISQKIPEWESWLGQTTFLKYMLDICEANDIEYTLEYYTDGFDDNHFCIIPEGKYGPSVYKNYFTTQAE